MSQQYEAVEAPPPQSADDMGDIPDIDSVRTFSTEDHPDNANRDSFIMRGRDSFLQVGRMSMEFAADAGTAIRHSIRDVKLVVGPLRKSYFANWTKAELILALVRDDYAIPHENIASTAALREIAKSHFEANGRFPPRPELPSAARHREMDDAALSIQKLWIRYYFLRKDQQVLRADLEGWLDSDDEMEFEWEMGRFDGDESTMNGDDMSYADNATLDGDDATLDGIEMALVAEPEPNTAALTGDTAAVPMEPKRSKRAKTRRVPPSLDVTLPWKQPSIEKAIANAEKYHPRLGNKGNFEKFDWLRSTTGRHCTLGGMGEQCDLWTEGTVSQLSKYGPGISNYFKFVKWLFWVFVALSILQAVPITFNTYGDEDITDGTSIDYIFATTAGNLGDSNRTYAITLPGCASGAYQNKDCEVSKQDLAIFYSSVAVCTALIVLAAYVWLRIFELQEVILLDKNTVSASDFTVTVSNLPHHFKPSELKNHFAALTNYDVADVRVAEDNEEDIMLFFKRGDLFRKRRNIVELYRYEKSRGKKKAKFYENLIEDIKEVTLKIQKIESLLAKHLGKQMKKNRDSVPLFAYVTFEESLGAHRALQIYRDTWFSYWFMDPQKLFKGCRLHLDRSPQPSIIIWENLGYTQKQRAQRRALTWVLSIVLLFLSAICTFSARAQEQRAQNEGGQEECPAGFDSWTEEEQIDYAEENPGTEHCYCSKLSLSEQSNDSFCRKYYEAQAVAGVFTYTGAVVVVVINGAIDFILKKCAIFEKHHSIDDLELSVFVRMFILKFINSGALFLLSNTPFILTTIYGESYHESVDFTPEWFATVGVNIMLVQMGDIILPHAWKIYRYFTFHMRLRAAKKDPSVALNQRELNELFMGPDFLLSTRYAQLMSNFYICLVFSTGMPVLCVIAVANYYISYWVDKFLFTNFYRTPPYFNAKIGQQATTMIPYAVLMFLGVAVWTLGNREIFRTKNNSSYSSYYRDYEPGDISQKVTQEHVVPLFVCFVILGIFMIIGFILQQFAGGVHVVTNGLCGRYLSKYEMYFELQQYVQTNINMSYRRATRRHIIKGLHTYKMFENPKYRAGFNLTKAFAKTHSDVSSIRFLEITDGNERVENERISRERGKKSKKRSESREKSGSSPSPAEPVARTSSGARRRQSEVAHKSVDLSSARQKKEKKSKK